MTSTTNSSFDKHDDAMVKGPNLASIEDDDNQNLIDFDEDDDGNNHEQENERSLKTDVNTSQQQKQEEQEEQQRSLTQSNRNKDVETSIVHANIYSENKNKREIDEKKINDKKKRYQSKSNTSNQMKSNLSFDRLNSGLYIPPRKRKLLEQARKESQRNNPDEKENDPASASIQRQKWEDMKKEINGTINRLNTSTIKPLLASLFETSNLIRGRGILTRTLIKAATTSPSFAHVYAAFIAVINTKLPEIGELLVTRSILAFRRFYRRKEKSNATAITAFIGHLINQRMAHELLGLQILALLLDGDPTDDSVEIAVSLTKTIGKLLSQISPSGLHAILERFRALLQEGSLSNRIQYQLEQLFQTKKKSWEGYPTVIDALDLVEEDDQITFETSLDDDLKKEDILDVFRIDDDWLKNEHLWKQIQDEILGRNEYSSDNNDNDDSETQSGQSDTNSNSDDSDSDSDANDIKNTQNSTALVPTQTQTIQDLSESDLIHLRRTIYLTIMSSATFEECAHKLAKTNIPYGRESELINMLIECCSQERTFLRYYALVSARFCILDKRWKIAFEESLKSQYETIHRLETNKLRNVAKLFAHLFHTHSFSWENLNIIKLNEQDTTSSSRIFIKILLQEMAEAMGMQQLKQQLEMANLEDMFPMNLEKPRDTRFAINFFTSIGLGPLTDGLREFLKNAPKLILAQAEAQRLKNEADDARSTSSSELSSSSSGSSSYSSSSSSYSSSSGSSNSSYSRNRRRRRKRRNSSYSSSSFDSRRYSSSSSRSYSSYSSSGSYSNKSKSSKSKNERNRRLKDRDSKHPKKSPKESKTESHSPGRKKSTKQSSKEQDNENDKSRYERSISRSPSQSSRVDTSTKQDLKKSKDESERSTFRSSDKKESKHSAEGRREKRHLSRDTTRSKSPSKESRRSNKKPNKRSPLRERSYSRSRSPSRSKRDENDQADNRHASRDKKRSRSPSENLNKKLNKRSPSRGRSYSRSRSPSRSKRNENERAENRHGSRGKARSNSYSRSRSPSRSKRDENDRHTSRGTIRSRSQSIESHNKSKKSNEQKYSSRDRSYSRSRSPPRSNDREDKYYSSRGGKRPKTSTKEFRSKNKKSNKQKNTSRERSYSRSRSYSTSDSRSSSYSSSSSRTPRSNSVSSASSNGSRERRRGDRRGEKRRRRKDSNSSHSDETNDDRILKRRK